MPVTFDRLDLVDDQELTALPIGCTERQAYDRRKDIKKLMVYGGRISGRLHTSCIGDNGITLSKLEKRKAKGSTKGRYGTIFSPVR